MTFMFILYTSSSTFCAYKKKRLLSAARMRHNIQHHCSSVELLPSFPVPILCTHGVLGEQASGTAVRIAIPARMCGWLGFWGASSRLLASSCWLSTSSSSSDRLLPGRRSRDCTTNIILHRVWFAISSNALCRLVRVVPPVPWPWIPPLGILLILLSLCPVRFLCS
jgi:hypothetical protein